jgi:hypothetical protein
VVFEPSSWFRYLFWAKTLQLGGMTDAGMWLCVHGIHHSTSFYSSNIAIS